MAPLILALRYALLSSSTARILAQEWTVSSVKRSILCPTIFATEQDSSPVPTTRHELFKREAFGNADGVCGYVNGYRGRCILIFNGVTADMVSLVQTPRSSAITRQIGASLIPHRSGLLAVVGQITKMIAECGPSRPTTAFYPTYLY